MSNPRDRFVLAHPTGNQNFRHLARGLRDAGLLAELCTAIDWRSDGAMAKLLPQKIAAELARRDFSGELGVPVAAHPVREMLRLAAGRLGWSRLTRHETGACSVDAVYREFDAWVARRIGRAGEGGGVYAYEDAAEASFGAARARGWRCVYDLPIAFWQTSRRLLAEEAERWPAWEPTLLGTRDSAEKCARKDRELALADLVVCPSRFVVDSLPEEIRATKRIVLAPFGSPPGPAGPITRRTDGPLRVLFVGAMTQRKGLADLFAAMRQLAPRAAELVVLGSPVAEAAFYRRQFPDFVYEAPRSHAEVLACMRTCDVFCLPSIVEGRALVVQEALSAGLPAIVTANTGADDAIEPGRNGFVVPIRAPQAIAEKIAWLADHRAALPGFSAAAQAAAARFTWSGYGAAVAAALRGEEKFST